jgi:predicted dehydrogenase
VIRDVVRRDLPAAGRVVGSLTHATGLLGLGHVEVALHDPGSAIPEQSLEGVDVLEPHSPNLLGRQPADPDGRDVLVVGAVEDDDLTRSGCVLVDAPQEVVGKLLVSRSLEGHDTGPARVHGADDMANRPVLPGAVDALQDDEERATVLGIEPSLQILDPRELGRNGRLGLGPAQGRAGRRTRIPYREIGRIAWSDTQLQHHGANHTTARGRRPVEAACQTRAMANESKLRIGFVGAGVIAWAHALALRALIREGLVAAELSVVHDRNKERAGLLADVLHLEVAADPDAVAERCDAVYVCTSTAGHLEAVSAATSHHRALFCEKPLARTLSESSALVRLATEAKVPAQAGLVLRTAPVFLELARLVQSGELGRPMVAMMRDDQFFPIQGHYASTWRKDVGEAGSGALLEHSIHDLDAARMCFGAIASISATTGNFAGYEGIEDAAAGVLRFEGGLMATLVSAWHSVLSRPSTRRVEVVFERGFVEFEEDFTGPITIQTSDDLQTRRCDPPAYVDEISLPEGRIGIGVRPYVEENKNFVDAILAGRPPSPGLEDALRAHEVVDAWYRSAASGGSSVAGPF